MDRKQLLQTIQESFAEMDAVVAELTEDPLHRPLRTEDGSSHWTIADVIAHVAAWKRNAVTVAGLLRDDPGPVPQEKRIRHFLDIDVESFNQQTWETWKDVSMAKVMREHWEAHEALVNAIRGLRDDQLLSEGAPLMWLKPTIGHVEEHLDQIKRSL